MYHHQVPPLVVCSMPAPDQKYLAEGTVEQTEQEEDDGVDHSRQGEDGSIDDRESCGRHHHRGNARRR
jgi:hypothetical protein